MTGQNLYYLCSNVSSTSGHSHNLKQWHEIIGHCNLEDVLKLESVVEGMKIDEREI